jgi:TPP-dependent pyruvate/acetoin dehydrogenase alpha subunit
MGGHATHDEREARATFDAQLFADWGKRDPIGLYETYLIEGNVDLVSGKRGRRTQAMRDRNAQALKEVEQRVQAEIEQAERDALESRAQRIPQPESAALGVYADGDAMHEKGAAKLAV